MLSEFGFVIKDRSRNGWNFPRWRLTEPGNFTLNVAYAQLHGFRSPVGGRGAFPVDTSGQVSVYPADNVTEMFRVLIWYVSMLLDFIFFDICDSFFSVLRAQFKLIFCVKFSVWNRQIFSFSIKWMFHWKYLYLYLLI